MDVNETANTLYLLGRSDWKHLSKLAEEAAAAGFVNTRIAKLESNRVARCELLCAAAVSPQAQTLGFNDPSTVIEPKSQ